MTRGGTAYDYHLLDVFTQEPFGGNQLAVFADATAIPPDLMPRIARELNLSETVFVLPTASPGALRRLRIFTPGMELPFAGHPTVGTACLLASLGVVGGQGSGEILLEEGVGNVRVRVHAGSGSAPSFAQLSAPQPADIREAPLDRARLAHLLTLGIDDVLEDDAHGPAAGSCGVPFLFVPLRNRGALCRCRLNAGAWESSLASTWAPHVFAYTFDAEREQSQIRARMFAPAMGIAEDPATGAAATALAALLAARAGRDGTHHWRMEQGFEMGRPSILELEADVVGGRVTDARVGGHAVVVGGGRLVV